jgi:hypothetical protein
MSKIRTQTGSIPYARYQLKRSILENVLENNYDDKEYAQALKYFNGCAFCGDPNATRKDHLIPVISNGDFTSNNIVPACQKCDDSKGQKEYTIWMRNSRSPKSLKIRKGMTDEEIERRINHIEKWQKGYKAKSEKELFGKYYEEYLSVLQEMDDLCTKARQLVTKVKTEYCHNKLSSSKMHLGIPVGTKKADAIRQYVIENYIIPNRTRNETTITIRSGEIHSKMHLHQQHANVCQTLRGNILQQEAKIKLISITGPKAGGNTYFEYQL